MPPKEEPKSRRTERCVFLEGGARCRRSGTGDPPLCHPHRLVMRDAGRPRPPLGGVTDLLDRLVNGRRVSRKVWEGAIGDVAEILGQHTQQQQQQQQPGNRPPPNWGWVPEWARPKPPAPPDPAIEARQRARIVLGFSPTEQLSLEILTRRRRELARKHHPDRGGSVVKMQAVNAAADVLEAELGSRTAMP